MNENSTTIKKLREGAEALAAQGIMNREALKAALPALIALQNAVKAARKSLKGCENAAKTLSAACTAYATAHPSVFDGKALRTEPNGVKVGDITLEEAAYHLSCGFDGYCRPGGADATQDFLATLPAEWTKSKLALDVSAINGAEASEEDLAAHGLAVKPKNDWSLKE